jgi:predicted dithiol-disulfide oxidoreductase (DUF899 family)
MNVVSHDAWIAARKELLAREKAFTHEREALAAARRALPLQRVERAYRFEGVDGETTLLDLFEGKRQLIVYHLMFAPEHERSCVGCAFVADHFDGTLAHLAARDTRLVAISRAPYPKLAAFARVMNWQFPWYSAGEGSFNYDFKVSFDERSLAEGTTGYNYGSTPAMQRDMPGYSVFMRDGAAIFHSYSCFSRGIDQTMNSYNLLDMTPLGRQEEPGSAMAWLRYHDRY